MSSCYIQPLLLVSSLLISYQTYQTSHSPSSHSILSLAMRTFALSAFASLAFGLFCSAAPLLDVSLEVTASDVLSDIYEKLHVNLITDRATISDLDAAVSFGVDSRETKTLDSILDGVVSAVDEIAEEAGEILFIRI